MTWWGRWQVLACVAMVCASATTTLADAFDATSSDGRLTLDAAVHIHTQYSTGSDALERVVEDARALGLDVVVITDDDLLEVTYGLPPWRHLVSLGRSHRSLLGQDTLGEYLAEIRHLDATHQDIVVIDGVESAPYYHWDVDPAQRRVTVQGWNKHLLAIGLGDEDSYRKLPMLGGEGNWESERDWFLLWPVAGLIWAAMLGPRRRWLRGGVTCICLLFLADSALTGLHMQRASPYDSTDETQAYQAYVDAVETAGGLSYWAHPEGASTIPPVRYLAGTVEVMSRTEAHAQDLIDTDGYTGFAALYADHITATEPDREWDRVLGDYLRGGRERPVWGSGEIDYHEDIVGNRLHDILTVIWAKSRTRSHVLEALRQGSSYAVRGGDERLRLRNFVGITDQAHAGSGQRLLTTGDFRIRADLDKVNGTTELVELRLIAGDQSGARVVAHIEGTTPLQLSHVDAVENGQARYYRLMARTSTSMLTSNPIFVSHETGQ